MVGALAPYSRFLGEKMLENVDFSKDKIIVELGPGTGVFTDLIIEKMAEDAQLYVFELNDNFFHSLNERINDPRVHIIHDSAEHIMQHLTGKVDVVVSSLPLMVFSEEMRNCVVQKAFESIKEKGKYIQFQYSKQSKKLLQSKYADVSIKFTVKNFPPAFIYTCLKA